PAGEGSWASASAATRSAPDTSAMRLLVRWEMVTVMSGDLGGQHRVAEPRDDHGQLVDCHLGLVEGDADLVGVEQDGGVLDARGAREGSLDLGDAARAGERLGRQASSAHGVLLRGEW